ncbi:MAG TPA: NAD(P)-binding domain-containing protein [Candidatus Dormibacteraeota bacterium]
MTEQPWVAGASASERPAEERERIAARMRQGAGGSHVLLSTCHRVELYGFGELPRLAGDLLLKSGEAAVVHLLRVAAGLESALVGEDEVLHQVRNAFQEAAAGGQLDRRLHRLFELAVATGRRARAGRSALGAGLADRAVDWLQGRSPLRGRPVLVAGAGRMGSALAHAARRRGALVTIASRDPERARRLASVYGGIGVSLAEGADLVPGSAGVAVALSGPWQELASLADPLPPIADISAPSAVPGALRARLNGGFLGVDDLFTGGTPPPAYVDAAERIVSGKAAEYLGWLEARS